MMSHAGYPWVLEACLVAWKHPNVYLELGAHRPKYFAAAGAGWEALMRFGQTTIGDKVRLRHRRVSDQPALCAAL